MKKPLSVILMWHMHQPQYKDPASSEYILPWTYLHAVKDYYDMAAVVDEVEGARAVFNFVPSLLEQLQDYAAGTALDPFIVHGRMNPAEMGEKEKLFVINNFFAANRHRRFPSRPGGLFPPVGQRGTGLQFSAGRAARYADGRRQRRDGCGPCQRASRRGAVPDHPGIRRRTMGKTDRGLHCPGPGRIPG